MSQNKKDVLLTQFIASYNEENWFAPLTLALDNLTEEEFERKYNENTHSIRQMVNHLIFWNERWLMRFKGEKLPTFNRENEVTFEDNIRGEKYENLKSRLYNIMSEWVSELEKCNEEKLDSKTYEGDDINEPWWESIGNIIIHNAYHIGQIALIRKQQGSWKRKS